MRGNDGSQDSHGAPSTSHSGEKLSDPAAEEEAFWHKPRNPSPPVRSAGGSPRPAPVRRAEDRWRTLLKALATQGTVAPHITEDADGIALMVNQGLNEKVEVSVQNAEVRSRKLAESHQKKETEIAQLKHELEKLKQVVDKLANVNH